MKVIGSIGYRIAVGNNIYYICCMETLIINIPEGKVRLVKELLAELGVSIKLKKQRRLPNADTIAAMEELKAGKGKKFKDVEALFNSI